MKELLMGIKECVINNNNATIDAYEITKATFSEA
jgi:hypothetical protein